MSPTTALLLSLFAAGAIVAWAFLLRYIWLHFRAEFLARLARERALGNQDQRRRLAVRAARGGRVDGVMRAETMPGWVWVTTEVRPRDEWEALVDKRKSRVAQIDLTHREQIGWALTRGGAERAMARRLRDEAGDADLILMLFGLLLLMAIFASGAPERVAKEVLGLLFDLLEQGLAWLRSLI